MKNDIHTPNPPRILAPTVLGGALSWTVPTFLANTFSALQARRRTRPRKSSPEGRHHPRRPANGRRQRRAQHRRALRERLLPQRAPADRAGANEGPETERRARPAHCADGFKDLYDAGRLAIVQGVGYPNPNRSHFRSTEIWQTASDSTRFEQYGWLGRYFDNACSGCDPTVGVSIGRQMPQAFAARQPDRRQLGQPAELPLSCRAGDPGHGEMSSMEESFRKLNQPEAESDENSGGTIGSLQRAGPAHRLGAGLPRTHRARRADQFRQDPRHRQPRGKPGDVSRFATGQFAQAGRQADRRRLADADFLRLARRLRHAHQPGQRAGAIAARTWAIR